MTHPIQPTLDDLRGIFSGDRCAILGNGPSLPEDLRTCLQLDPLILVVGVNRSWHLQSSILHVALDGVHAEELQSGLWSTGTFFTKEDHACSFQRTKQSCVVLSDPAPAAWPLARHIPQAGPAAVQVALWLGMSEIVLCGFDMHDGDGRRFYEQHTPPTSFRSSRRYMRRLKVWTDDRGVEVSCASKRSMLVEESIVPVWTGGE